MSSDDDSGRLAEVGRYFIECARKRVDPNWVPARRKRVSSGDDFETVDQVSSET